MTERLTFKLTTGQEILIGYRETPRQKRKRRRGPIVPSEAAALEVIEYRREYHPPECRCDDCVPF